MTIANSNVAPEKESAIRKIQKLLQLAQSKTNDAQTTPEQREQLEREAALAMAKAQELLVQNNLEAAMVQDTVVKGGTVQAEEKREKTRVNRSAKYKWQVTLWKALAEANFCMHWVASVYEGKRNTNYKTSKVPVKRHVILGKESNVVVVRLMGEYLEDTIERMLPYGNQERMSRSALSWKTGVAERLAERVTEKMEEIKRENERRQAEAASTTAIALRDVLQAEYQMNYDARWGEGAYNRRQIADAQWEAGREERERKAKEDREKAEREWLEYLKNETPEQKKQREREEAKQRRQEARASERRWARWDREREREASKLDSRAYDAGFRKGNEINLDAQVGSGVAGKDRQIA